MTRIQTKTLITQTPTADLSPANEAREVRAGPRAGEIERAAGSKAQRVVVVAYKEIKSN